MLEAATCGPITRLHLGRTVFGRPLYTVNAYLVDGLLIDTGCPATAAELVAWCRGRDVRRAINTHHHEDHAGGDLALQQALGLPIAAPPQAVPVLADYYRLQPYRRIVWGQPRDVVVEPLADMVETEHYCFEVIPTPGHSPDHVCLFEREQGWLFSGDLFINERVRYLRADEDPWGILASLRRALALRPRLLICSHAGFVKDACRAIERKCAYWQGLAEQARALRGDGLSLREVTDRLLGAESLMTRFTRGHFGKINLVRALLEEGPPVVKGRLPARFIGLPIQVAYDRPPTLEKRPGPPDSFTWEGRTYRVAAVLREWHDYRQRGKTKAFYVKERGSFRAKAAERRGTWGVGRDYYRVRADTGEVFDIYYDRSPRGPGGPKGSWFLFREILEEASGGQVGGDCGIEE